jgi:hypothetical protein
MPVFSLWFSSICLKDIVAYLLHAGTVELQKPQNTHTAIELRIGSVCCLKHGQASTIERQFSMDSAPRPLLCDSSVNISIIGTVFSVWSMSQLYSKIPRIAKTVSNRISYEWQ